jgi:hypothetical protein
MTAPDQLRAAKALILPHIVEQWNVSPFRITNYAPSHRQFRLPDDLTPEQITAAVGSEPTRRVEDEKVTVEWTFFAEKHYHDGADIHTVSTCCKIWDYYGCRWSAYGFPEAFEQLGLRPQLEDERGYREDGNPTIAILTGYARAIALASSTPSTDKGEA